jgi:CRP/FNR family transcriptional regulator, anaerobic regulatory protein
MRVCTGPLIHACCDSQCETYEFAPTGATRCSMKSVSRPTFYKRPPNIHLSCGLLESCHPAGSLLGRPEECSTLACTRTLVKRGKRLFESGDPISSIYSVMAGTFKTCTETETGQQQVMGFYMRGAILGLDAMATGHYPASAIALEDSQVCIIAAEYLDQHCLQHMSVAKRIRAAMAREINAQHRMIVMLGSKTAEERVASFLIELAARYFALGYSSNEMNLVMKRDEIGSYLGLKLETVSRILSDFHDRELLAVDQKHIRILDIAGLKRLTH